MSTRFTVTATRSGGWWAIEVDQVPQIHTQSRRIDQIPAVAADALSMWLEEEVTPEDVSVRDMSNGLATMPLAVQARRDAEEADKKAATLTRLAAREASLAGYTVRDIARMLDVSTAYAARIAKSERADTTA